MLSPKSSICAGRPNSGEGVPRVVHLVPCDGHGGVETAARSAAASTAIGCDLTVYFLAGKTVAEQQRRILEHPSRRLNDPRTLWAATRDLLMLRPDVLVCSLWRSMLVGTAVKRLRPATRLVIFLHYPQATHLLDRLAQRIAFSSADAFWADSQATLNAYKKNRKNYDPGYLFHRSQAAAPNGHKAESELHQLGSAPSAKGA